jgi:competence protein ComEC
MAKLLLRYRMQRLVCYLFTAIVVSVSVQLVLLPFLIVYFHRLSLASLVLNIGVSVIMAGLTLTAMAALLVAQFSSAAAAPLISLCNGLNWLMVHSVDPFAQFGLASIRLPRYTGAATTFYWFYYVPLTILAIGLGRWNPLVRPTKNRVNHVIRKLLVPGWQIIMLGIVTLHPLSQGRLNGKLQVDFLDVGQGDSALVTMPDGTTLLIDGGGRPNFSPNFSPAREIGADEAQFSHEARSVGEAVVSEYLWWRGLDSVDYLLATHADADHIDGLNDVARNFRVRAAFVARAPQADPEFQKLAATLRAREIPLFLIGKDDVLRIGKVSAEVLWPIADNNLRAPSRNNDSVTLRLEFGERSFVLTGDIEKGAETAILAAGERMRVDCVKVAHHGSKTSSTEAFVAATRPEFAVISVGQTSIFGHPNKEVVERWKAAGAWVLTTGRSGTITFTTDGRDLQFSAFAQ